MCRLDLSQNIVSMTELYYRNMLLKFLFGKITLFVVCITGLSVLVIEVVATRILSPYFGNTIYTYSSIISVILAALSIGYYIGGRISDKHPEEKYFYGIIILSGFFSFCIEQIIVWFLQPLSHNVSLVYGPLIFSLGLFFLPSFFLGMLTPYAITLQNKKFPETGIGKISGEVFFWSTFGSIGGGLITGFYLIPNFGVDAIIIGVASLLTVIGFLGLFTYSTKIKYLYILLFIFCLIAAFSIVQAKVFRSYGFLYEGEGIYEKILVYDKIYKGHPARFLRSELNSSSAIYLDSDDLLFEYSKYYSLYSLFNNNPKRILVLGGGAYTIPKKYLLEISDAKIDVVEFEPTLYGIAKKYFKLEESPRLNNYTEDARRFLLTSDTTYDVIFNDVYLSLYSVPSHVITKEFFLLAKSKLNEGGIIIMNLIGDIYTGEKSLVVSGMATFNSVFENNYFFATNDPKSDEVQNIILLGINSNQKIDFQDTYIKENQNEIINNLEKHLILKEDMPMDQAIVFTDNFVPTEIYTATMLERSLTIRE